MVFIGLWILEICELDSAYVENRLSKVLDTAQSSTHPVIVQVPEMIALASLMLFFSSKCAVGDKCTCFQARHRHRLIHLE